MSLTKGLLLFVLVSVTINCVCGKSLVVSLDQKTIVPAGEPGAGNVRVRVTDEDGKPGPKAKVVLLKVYPGKQEDNVLASNKEFTPVSGDSSLYELNFLALKPDTGSYTLEVSATPTDSKGNFEAADGVELTVKVPGQATISDATLIIADSEDPNDISEGRKHKLEPAKQLATPIKVDHFQHIFVDFKVKGQGGKNIAVHQAFLRLYNEAGREYIVPAKYSPKGYSAHISVRDAAAEFYGQSGNYKLQLIVGDASIQNPIQWTLGTITINYPAELKAEVPRNPFEPLPEIKHQFRQPDKRPPRTISMAFTVAVLAIPFLVLFIGLIRVGANLKNFPGGANFIYAIGFEACLAAVLGLFVLYWLYLNMVQTLGYLALLSIPMLFFAHKNLNGLSRVKQHAE